MYMRDKLGSFEMIVDKERRVVHEKLAGLFTCDDSNRLDKEYVNYIVPYLGKGEWAKLCDMTEYMVNTSVSFEDISRNLKNMVPHGFAVCAIITSNVVVKDYISMAAKDVDAITFAYFTCEQDADEYLRRLGY
ncbi:MAG: hypothetical protein K0R84_2027 [Clostridia bacterium]|nr:hypothetical protein [Clostridia bacterium]